MPIFWNAVTLRLDNRPATILRHYRPRVALLSPVPPDRSGVADYSAATCAELGKLVDLHVFTETAEPAPQRNVATVRPLSALPSLMTGFDRVINVVGNSHFHVRIFDCFHRMAVPASPTMPGCWHSIAHCSGGSERLPSRGRNSAGR